MPKIHPHLEKQLWLWGGVGVVMTALIGLWFYTLPQRLPSLASNPADKLWTDKKNELDKLLGSQEKVLARVKDLASWYKNTLASLANASAVSSLSAASSTINLTPEQLEKIKKSIEQK